MSKGIADDKNPAMKVGSWNSGRETTKAQFGQTVYEDFPLDRSTDGGSREMERNGNLTGSPTDLSHSLRGVSAVQEGEKGGHKDTVKDR